MTELEASLRTAIEELARIEHRGDRSYDEQGVSTIVLPNGTLVCSTDRPFLVAALGEAAKAWKG